MDFREDAMEKFGFSRDLRRKLCRIWKSDFVGILLCCKETKANGMNKDNHDENKGDNCQGVGQDLFGQEAAQSCFFLRQRPFYLFERLLRNILSNNSEVTKRHRESEARTGHRAERIKDVMAELVLRRISGFEG